MAPQHRDFREFARILQQQFPADRAFTEQQHFAPACVAEIWVSSLIVETDATERSAGCDGFSLERVSRGGSAEGIGSPNKPRKKLANVTATQID